MGIGANDCQRSNTFVQRQRSIILEQNHALPGDFTRQRPVFYALENLDDVAFIHIGIIKKPQLEFFLYMPADGQVNCV